MTEQDLKKIQEKIGYNFKNICLLQQAFIRESFAKDNIEHSSNESLRWVGKKVLANFIDQKLIAAHMKVNDVKELVTQGITSEELLKEEEYFLSEAFIAKQIETYGLNEYMVMGEEDIKRKANNKYSVKKELLEAIIGAVSIDSNNSVFPIKNVIDSTLDIDFYINNGLDAVNYVQKLHEWAKIGQYKEPRFMFNSNSFNYDKSQSQCTCFLDQVSKIFTDKGPSKPEARVNAAKLAYKYLAEHNMLFTIKDIAKEYNEENAISVLQELAAKKYVAMPFYEYECVKDEEHDQIWVVTCTLDDKVMKETSLTKKDAKKKVAYNMLKSILE